MSDGKYKKSYDGDYTKTYKDYISWRKESAARQKEYDTISKKLNDSPYNKRERLSNYDIVGRVPKASERVHADGSTISREQKKTSKRNWDNEKPYTPAATPNELEERQVEQQSDQPTIFPPLQRIPSSSAPKAEENKTWKNAYEVNEEDDGNYNYYDYPVEQIGVGRYRNAKTKKELTLDQAKSVLKTAGFYPTPNNTLGAAVFAFIIANIAMPLAAPLVAIGYGVFRLQTKTTTWQRVSGNQKFKMQLPATDSELTVNKLVARVIIVIGAIAAFIRYSTLF